jgi:hypothetical protein
LRWWTSRCCRRRGRRTSEGESGCGARAGDRGNEEPFPSSRCAPLCLLLRCIGYVLRDDGAGSYLSFHRCDANLKRPRRAVPGDSPNGGVAVGSRCRHLCPHPAGEHSARTFFRQPEADRSRFNGTACFVCDLNGDAAAIFRARGMNRALAFKNTNMQEGLRLQRKYCQPKNREDGGTQRASVSD